MLVELLPTNKRNKQLRKEKGKIWDVVREPKPLLCFDGDIGIGIESLDGQHFRNVRLSEIKEVGV